MTGAIAFTCSICGEPSTRICACCTKDSCDNHLCLKCGSCSDCCGCDVPLDEVTAPLPVSQTETPPQAEVHAEPAEPGPEPAEARPEPEPPSQS